MRLCIPSYAIISLFAGTSHAFAPPISLTSSSDVSLRAANGELSGMLSDYSGTTTTATKTAIAKVTETVVSSPPTPPAVNPSEITDSAVDAVSKAASASQDAAEQAAAAAAAVSSKVAAATKTAAAVGGGAVAGGFQLQLPDKLSFDPPSPKLIQFTPVDPTKVDTANQFDASARAQDNLVTFKSNFLNFIGSDGSVSSFDVPKPISLPDVGASGAGLAAIIQSLHIQEYGGWYAATALAIIASQQRGKGEKIASAKFESELTNAQTKANEAASAAGLAADGANKAKKLALKMEKDLKKDEGQALLESSRSKKAQMERDMMEKEMSSLQAEVVLLKNQLDEAKGTKEKKGDTKVKVKTEIEEEYPTIVTMESDPEEDQRVVELLKLMDEENAIKKKVAAEALEKKREEEAKFVAAEKAKAESKKIEKKREEEAKFVAAEKAKAESKKIEKKREEEAKFVAAEKAKAESKKMAKGVESAQVKAEAVTKKMKGATKKAATKSKSGTKKKAVSKKKASGSAAASDDWTSLAESTLKRKTVAQLTEYLTGKGVGVSGKKKAELLDLVKSL